jgi:hypothetical protein
MTIKNIINDKVKTSLKSAANWILVVATTVSAFLLGYYFPLIKTTISGKVSAVEALPPTVISVSVTDRGELLIMDRSTGKFNVYDESIGLNVFKAYGARITQSK